MKLELIRKQYSANATVGELHVDGAFQCYTLEDTVRMPGVKVWGKTAIPSGAYAVALTHSPRFKQVLPLLLNVPGFEGIRIHKGNDANDTEGCILVGRTAVSENFIGESKLAFDALMPLLTAAVERKEQITIVINDTYAAPPTEAAPPVSAPASKPSKGGKK